MVETNRAKEKLNLGRRIVVFVGPEGAGKTTHAKQLTEESGRPYITTGDIIRDLAENDQGALGDECRGMFANHRYLDGETLLAILVDRFGKADAADGFVLDGGLRTLEETKDFQKMLMAAGRTLPLTIIYLGIPRPVTFERLVTGEKARQRLDDTITGVTSRLSKFHHQLEERIGVIIDQPSWDFWLVDANRPLEDVYAQVCQVFSEES